MSNLLKNAQALKALFGCPREGMTNSEFQQARMIGEFLEDVIPVLEEKQARVDVQKLVQKLDEKRDKDKVEWTQHQLGTWADFPNEPDEITLMTKAIMAAILLPDEYKASGWDTNFVVVDRIYAEVKRREQG